MARLPSAVLVRALIYLLHLLFAVYHGVRAGKRAAIFSLPTVRAWFV